ncbi:rRNA methyltransferase [Candidatus Poribacteria bacterium]|nr:rRNA methyltransferase [Candidatus Poribacteria bacterium]
MLISSATNPRIKHAGKLLKQRKFRQQHGEFVVEGVQAVAEALAQGWRLRQVYYHDESVRSEKALQVLDELDARICIELTRPVLTRLSERPENPAELIAVVAAPRDDLARVPVSDDMLAVVMEEPRDPGNLGAVIRTADALGVGGVVLLGPTVDLYGPKTVRATMGSLFAVPVAHVADVDGLAAWLAKVRETAGELRVVATVARDAGPVHDHDFRGATVVVVGNERRGISDELRAVCDAAATIPMTGAAESLNSAVATSIVLYEACRQRAAGA